LVNSTGHHDRDRAPTDGTHRPVGFRVKVQFGTVKRRSSAQWRVSIATVTVMRSLKSARRNGVERGV
jgi:hypothetical protein